MSGCAQCGMWVDPKKPYHPYAACLMFMGCKNGNTVQANLNAVVEYGRDLERNKADAAPSDAETLDPTARGISPNSLAVDGSANSTGEKHGQ